MAAHLDEELSAYLDGDLAGDELESVERHLTQCAECRATLERLRGLVRRARALDDRPPERELWAGIAARLGEAATPDVVVLTPRRRRIAVSIPQLAAAGLALVLVSGGAAVLLTRGPAGRATAARGEPVAGTVAAAVSFPAESGVASYDAAIADLQAVLAARRSQLDTATVRSVELSLRVIDLAIAQARLALAQDPNNGYLNGHLRRALDRKLDVLRRAALMPAVS